MSWLWQPFLVGCGGFFGAMLRYGMSGAVQRLAPFSSFPLGTLTVNVSGSLLIGVLAGLVELRQMLGPEARLFLMIGLLGGFTTFSSFAYETLALGQDGQYLLAALNALSSVALCLLAVWIGYRLAGAA
jgi:CrcB protein